MHGRVGLLGSGTACCQKQRHTWEVLHGSLALVPGPMARFYQGVAGASYREGMVYVKKRCMRLVDACPIAIAMYLPPTYSYIEGVAEGDAGIFLLSVG